MSDSIRVAAERMERLRAAAPELPNPERLTSLVMNRIEREPRRETTVKRDPFAVLYRPAVRYAAALVVVIAASGFMLEYGMLTLDRERLARTFAKPQPRSVVPEAEFVVDPHGLPSVWTSAAEASIRLDRSEEGMLLVDKHDVERLDEDVTLRLQTAAARFGPSVDMAAVERLIRELRTEPNVLVRLRPTGE